jgi:hypothetical protein
MTCQPCASNKCHITHICLYHEPSSTNHVSINVSQPSRINQCIYLIHHVISTINHVPIILLASASTNVPSMYQSCINYRFSFDSSMMYNIITSSTHQLHFPICSSTTCQMHAPRHPTNMPLTIHHKIYQ